jgi:DNA repair exonuclease SbcCD ATPase subunit
MLLSKKDLLSMCKILGLRVKTSSTKEQLHKYIKDQEDTKNVKILDTTKHIKHIYHTADIHIRCLDRHQEYFEVFEKLYQTLSSQPELDQSVIVVCGDIFHNRDKLVSESIKLFDFLIEKLTSIIDVILILGNHDTFTHNDRLDTITGIVDIKTYKNFHFLKNSGIYKYNNIDFIVSSLTDNKFIRHSDIPKSDNLSVALYHGAISGSKIDSLYSMNDSNLFTIGDFKGYDLTLLGDIHLKQHLTPTIAYPGSLIQQNYKEELEHGILKWDTSTKKSEFIKIDNDYGYISVDITKINELVFPKKSRIKLYHDYDTDFDIEKIKKELSEKTTIISLTKEIKVQPIDITLNSPKTPIISRETVLNDTFDRLTSNLDDKIKKEIVSLHKMYIDKYNTIQEDHTNSMSWKISELEFMNVFIYGGDHINKIIFDKNSSVIGILESNAAGKSSIFNTIMYLLFGNTYMKSKNYSNRNIINKNSKKFYIKMTIESEDNTKYIIEKNGKNKTRSTETGIEEEVTFKKIVGGVLENLTDSNKINTVIKIHKTLGLTTKDTFILTNVLSNVQYVSLLNMTASDISETFSNLFDMKKYKEIYSIVLKKCKEISDTIKYLEGQRKNILDDKKDIIHLNKQLSILRENVIKNTENLESIEIILNGLTKEEIDIGKVENIKEQCLIENLDEKLQKYMDSVSKINTDELHAERKELNSNISTLNSKKINFKKGINAAQYKSLKDKENFSVKDFIDDLKEYTCDTDTVTIAKDLYDDILELFDDLNTEVYLSNSIKIKEYENNLEYTLANKKISDDINELEKNVNIINNTLEEYAVLNDKICKLTDHKAKTDLFNANKEKITLKNNIVQRRKENVTNQLNCKYKLAELYNKIGKIENELQIQDSLLIKNTKVDAELKTETEKSTLYKIYKGLMSDKSLPKMVLLSTIKKIEIDANIMIYKLIGLYVLFNTDKEDGKWEITIKKNGMILGIEHISGFERLVINLGLKISLDRHQYNSSIKFFAIDECFDCISDDNYHKVDDIFKLLKENYNNVLIISHNDSLKNKVDSRIKISTDFVCSKIQ